MPIIIRSCINLLLSCAAIAQQPAEQRPDPVTLVSRAEALLKKGEKEDATMMLWQALDELRVQPGNAIREATRLSARYLLKEHDPLEEERRRAFTEVAERQVAIGKSYRLKKWYDTAAGRLDVAGQYDPDAVTKERAALDAKRPEERSAKVESKAPESPEAPSGLTRGETVRVIGNWREVDGELECGAHPSSNGGESWEWTTRLSHEDHEIWLEFRPLVDQTGFNFGLALGLPSTNLRVVVFGFEGTLQTRLFVYRVQGMQMKLLAESKVDRHPDGDHHLLTARVSGQRIRVQLDGQPALATDAPEAVRGMIGLTVGADTSTSCALRFRNLKVAPLPADQPSDEQLREQAIEQRQHAVTAAVDKARELLEQKQNEPAASSLRDALQQVHQLPAGILRTNLAQSITEMLQKADPIARKRHEAALACATALGLLADKYVADGRPRLGMVMAQHAHRFDPDGQAQRLVAIEKAIDDWNVKQAVARKDQLAPPPDDGALLRQWFEGGQALDRRSPPWTVAGPEARVDNVADAISVLMPKAGTLLAGTFGVHVRLPAPGCYAGVCFDVAGPHDYSIAMLSRDHQQLRLVVTRYTSGTWTDMVQKAIPMDTWRLDAWHPIAITTTPTGIKMAAAGAEVTIDQKRLGLRNGRVGLCAGNAVQPPATVALRAFHAKPE